ncbi:hypothetical protein PP740_gp001 [Stenotrophomonas phage Philippe]|uniref:Uncharacterized protein n=1 Tax=Stenotrophomonas phage Philippe TaxID=2859655 RepID=A0AAE8BI30_9CAUD|nr:hypothetical protein PP740_gp001 [Stenotrophomonas phage Philippe]QYW02200.1 hypothetical protein CPT_Philippe_001 [Stenotrophomonas phage Philippe]
MHHIIITYLRNYYAARRINKLFYKHHMINDMAFARASLIR